MRALSRKPDTYNDILEHLCVLDSLQGDFVARGIGRHFGHLVDKHLFGVLSMTSRSRKEKELFDNFSDFGNGEPPSSFDR
jgi:hypothetical protein